MGRKKQPSIKASRSKRAIVSVRRMLDVLKAGGDLRKRKIRRLRAAVRAKRYENELKLSIAVDRMLAAVTKGV